MPEPDPPRDDDGPSERNNWNSILKWSLGQTDDGLPAATDDAVEPESESDATVPVRTPISEEDRRWFLHAMQSGMIDEIKRMKLITQALAINVGEILDAEEVAARRELLEELQDRVGSIDNGGDLHTIGGLVPLIDTCARSPHATLRAAAAEVLAITVQNHIKAQDAALDNGAMTPLLEMASGRGVDRPPTSRGDSGNAEEAKQAGDSKNKMPNNPEMGQCRVKALLGLSCLLRGHLRAQEAFTRGGGFALLRDCLQVDDSKVRTKALHLARHLVTLNMEHMAAGVDAGFIAAAAAALARSLLSISSTERSGGTDADSATCDATDIATSDATDEEIAAGQVREAALRLLLDMAQCVDFEKVPEAADHFRSDVVARVLAAARVLHDGLGAADRETFMDEIDLRDKLQAMFG
mmetsp:Transcript_21789/g.53839  ORF Transcript_21789/g.53839 Transcript_21789/m.53839 type:complete len:410 (-) Transcript_21789:248-1477(-)|eukprot:CAMPEP_0181361694 /NCGR_PEP_ID=MMETSP1106-20121128/7487_1 /TAXON_ID=81844 /ORGANISM="Mantoniella antarctica, Strain SL-175" /LENGTH=409 /DNA_ID=CAMNT_0023475353 /DNA_START=83 /DNA_END=1312 /DNA_ORIENTATION=-